MTSFKRILAAAGDGSHNGDQVKWAVAEIDRAFTLNKAFLTSPVIETVETDTIRKAAETSNVELSAQPESLVLFANGENRYAWGGDTRGLVFALTEIADRILHSKGDGLGRLPLIEAPSAPIRSMARLFCSEQEDKPWFYDKQGWRDYLSMLTYNRFNRFSLTLGMGYNYPYHNSWITDVYFYFPYPFLLDIPGYDAEVVGLSPSEREDNLEMLKFIGREARRRGLDFQLALWTQRYDFDDVPHANHTISGVTGQNLAPYCRKAITALLKECPEITGLTFRVHVEGGIAEGEYGFWEQAFAGVADCGRPVEIDMHAKGLDHKTIEIARSSGMPVTVSPKYLAEHMGPPYHQSAIRDKEYPPEVAKSQREQLSEGSRKFLRYSYGDLLTADRDYKVLFRIWPGTQRFLLWGDPEMAAGYGRSSTYCGSDGVEWCEPLSFKGRMGTTQHGQRAGYTKQGLATSRDWERYAYQYRVWGRLIYNPDAPRESWMRHLEAKCGTAAQACEKGMALASRILPLITLAHGPSASNNFYWPEIYTNLPLLEGSGRRAYAFDMEGPLRFGNAPTFDSMLFANPREFVTALYEGKPCGRYTPLDVADWLEDMAKGCDEALAEMGPRTDHSAETRRIRADIGILTGIARYFAAKFRAACWSELYVLTGASTLIDTMMSQMECAVDGWRDAANVSRDIFPEDITFGPQSWLRGSWQSRLAEIEAELLELEAVRGAHVETTYLDEKGEKAARAITERPATKAQAIVSNATARFEAGQDIMVRARAPEGTEALTLYYRHVNQAERWRSSEMKHADGDHQATIPGSYTDTQFSIQYFVSAQVRGATILSPGLNDTLSNEPYYTMMRGD